MRKGLILINSNDEGCFSTNDEATLPTQGYVSSTADIFGFPADIKNCPTQTQRVDPGDRAV